MKVKYFEIGKFDVVMKYAVTILVGFIQLAFGAVFIWFAVNYPSDDWKWFFGGAMFLVIINLPLFFILWIQWSIRWIQAESDYILREKGPSLK